MSARDWLEKCRITLPSVIPYDERGKVDVKTRLLLIDCAREIAQVWCKAGYVPVKPLKTPTDSKEKEEMLAALKKDCPHPLFAIPSKTALNYWSSKSLYFWEGWLSSDSMFSEAFENRWPKCLETRRRYDMLPRPEHFKACMDFYTPKWDD